ncbi:pullulanase precursor [bacterium BMS3Bbin04]|nr:pullulanase precursor [bacterium BMS3Bbin04]
MQKGVDEELTPDIIKRAKLGFFLLFISRGMLMLHEGDEWLRAKIVAGDKITNRAMKAKLRKLPGQLDLDSYNRDDTTNWLDWEEAEDPVRSDIREYVKGMAHLRKMHPALRLARHANLHPLSSNDNSLLAYVTRVPGNRLVILVNLNENRKARVNLPEGTWVVLADETKVRNPNRGRAHTDVEVLPPMSARLLASRDQIRRGK